MLSRRQLLAALAVIAGPKPGRAEAVLTDDGLYVQPWFLQSFLELADDLQGAARAGKRFAVMWELKGCPYCKETHLVNFADPAIEAYIRGNFDILQLDIVGSRMVTDFDGDKLTEKALARKYNIRFTPTFQFFPETAEGLAEKAPEKREVARMPGYLKPEHFLALFRFVRDKAYDRIGFRDYLKEQRS